MGVYVVSRNKLRVWIIELFADDGFMERVLQSRGKRDKIPGYQSAKVSRASYPVKDVNMRLNMRHFSKTRYPGGRVHQITHGGTSWNAVLL